MNIMGLYSSKVYIGEGGGGNYVREVYGITKTCRCFLNFHLKKLVMFSSQNIRGCEYILNDVKSASWEFLNVLTLKHGTFFQTRVLRHPWF